MQSSILCMVLYNTWTFTLKFQGFQNSAINFYSFQGLEIIKPLFQNFQGFQNRVRTLNSFSGVAKNVNMKNRLLNIYVSQDYSIVSLFGETVAMLSLVSLIAC